MRCADPLAEVSVREAREVLDAELARLPEQYRGPLILCCLEGATRDEAAQQLGLTLSAVKKRLERGRALLLKRLARRGLTLGGALLGSLWAEATASAAPPSLLVTSTVKAAATVAAGGAVSAVAPAEVAALTERVLRAMLLTKLKIATAVFLTVALLGGAASLGILHGGTQEVGAQEPPGKSGKQLATKGEGAGPSFTWKERFTIQPPDAGIRQAFGVAVSPDGKRIAVTYDFTGPKVFDVTTGQELVSLPQTAVPMPGVAYSPDGKLIALADTTVTGNVVDAHVLLLSADSGEVRARLKGGSAINIHSLAFSADGKTLLTAGDSVYLFDVATNKEIRQFKSDGPRRNGIYCVAFSHDGKMVASAEGSDQTVKVWEAATGKEIATFKHDSWATSVAFSRDGKTIASGVVNHVKLWDLTTGKERATFKCPALHVAFSPDGKLLASQASKDDQGQRERIVRLWDVATGKQIAALAHNIPRDDNDPGMLRSVVFSRDGTLVTVGDDAVRFWKMEKK
jgi:DNA-binding beta-propeller fold protein YncE